MKRMKTDPDKDEDDYNAHKWLRECAIQSVCGMDEMGWMERFNE